MHCPKYSPFDPSSQKRSELASHVSSPSEGQMIEAHRSETRGVTLLGHEAPLNGGQVACETRGSMSLGHVSPTEEGQPKRYWVSQ